MRSCLNVRNVAHYWQQNKTYKDTYFPILEGHRFVVTYVVNTSQILKVFKDIHGDNIAVENHVDAEYVIKYLQLYIFSRHTVNYTTLTKHFHVKNVVDISQSQVTFQFMQEFILVRDRMYVENVAKAFQFIKILKFIIESILVRNHTPVITATKNFVFRIL
jgi:hypothetical protein